MARNLTIPQRNEAKIYVSQYYTQGLSSRRIALKLKEETGLDISHVTVQKLIKDIIQDLREQYADKLNDLMFVNLERYSNLEAEMWAAWEISKTQRRKTYSRRKGKPITGGGNTVRGVRTESVEDAEELSDGRGDPRYAAIILECIEKRMEWLFRLSGGVLDNDGAQVINHTNNNITLNVQPAQRVRSPKMLEIEAQEATMKATTSLPTN